MKTIEFMEKVKEVHDKLTAIALEQGIGFIVMAAAGQEWEDAVTYGAWNMDYPEQIRSLHLFHKHIDRPNES